jgi:YVTN family beta-propeller protein
VIDGATSSAIATVAVGAHPQAIGINSATHTIFSANTHSNNVTIIDGTNNSVIATMPTGNGPYAVAVDTASNKAYVSNIGKNSLTVIDGRQTTTGGRRQSVETSASMKRGPAMNTVTLPDVRGWKPLSDASVRHAWFKR